MLVCFLLEIFSVTFDEVDAGLEVFDLLPELAFFGIENGFAFGDGLRASVIETGVFFEVFETKADITEVK